MQTGRALDGVDFSLVASILMLLAMGPRAYQTREPVPTVLSALSSVMLMRMGYVSYGLRHGH